MISDEELAALPRLVGLPDVARVMDRNVETIRRLAKAGKLGVPTVKVGDHYVVPRHELWALVGFTPAEVAS